MRKWTGLGFAKPQRTRGALRPQKPLRLIRDGEVGGPGDPEGNGEQR